MHIRRLFVIGLVSLISSGFFISSGSCNILVGTHFIPATKYGSERWTVQWGTDNHDYSTAVVEDSNSGDTVLGTIAYISSLDYVGVISRIDTAGALVWSTEIPSSINAKPHAIAVSSNYNRVYVAVGRYNVATATDELLLMQFDLESGAYINQYLIASKINDQVMMGWTGYGKLCIVAEVPDSYGHSLVNVTLFIPAENKIISPMTVQTHGYDYCSLLDIIPDGFNRNLYILIGYSYSELIISETYVYELYPGGTNVNTIQDYHLSFAISNLNILGLAGYESEYYCAIQSGTTLGLIRYDSAFEILVQTNFTLANCLWENMLFSSPTAIYIIGSGSGTFLDYQDSASQGLVLQISLGSSGFVQNSSYIFGVADLADKLSGGYRAADGDVYFYGSGLSYGPSPATDYDAFLILYRSHLNPTTTSTSSSANPLNSRQWMLIGIFGFIGVYIGISVWNRKRVKKLI